MPRKFLGGTPTVETTALVTNNDSRLSDARTPTAHKTSHATGGSDALTAADIGAASASHSHAGGGAYSTTIGDGSATMYTITHLLGTRDVLVECYSLSSGVYETLQPTVTRPTVDTVILYFLSAPAASSVRVLVRS